MITRLTDEEWAEAVQLYMNRPEQVAETARRAALRPIFEAELQKDPCPAMDWVHEMGFGPDRRRHGSY